MKKPANILLERIDLRLAALGKTRYWLSVNLTAGGTGKGRGGVITDLERKGFIPHEARLHRMAELLETTTDYLLGRSESSAQVRSEVGLSEKRLEFRGHPQDAPMLPLVGTGDCAAIEVTDLSGAPARIERCSFDPEYHVRYIQRPAALAGDQEAYAIYFHGASMEPRFFAGEIGIAQPSRPAGPGDYVIVQLADEKTGDVVSVVVKRLVRLGAGEITLEQHNPPLVFSLPRSQVARIHRIYRPDELLAL